MKKRKGGPQTMRLSEDELLKYKNVSIEDLRQKAKDGYQAKQLSDYCGLNAKILRKLMVKFNIETNKPGRIRINKLLSKENLEKDCRNALGQRDMMKKYRVCQDPIMLRLRKYGLKSLENHCKLRLPYEEMKRLCEQYTIVAIAHLYKVHRDSVETLARYHNLTPQPMPPHTNISVPCEYLKKRLKEIGYDFIEEYRPFILKNRDPNETESKRYAFDVCFLKQKVVIEINGHKHYANGVDGALAPYYQERHDIFVARGWRILEIPYLKAWDQSFYPELVTQLATLGVHPTAPATETAIT